jgi:hypothetical protein
MSPSALWLGGAPGDMYVTNFQVFSSIVKNGASGEPGQFTPDGENASRYARGCAGGEGGSLYRSTGHNINGQKIKELQINCFTDQQNPVDVYSIIKLTNMLLRSTAPHINKYT